MRILVHDYAGHPFQAEFSRALARRGHVVTHAYRAKVGGRSGALERLPDDPEGLRFQPIILGARASQRRGVGRRLRHELTYGRAAARTVEEFRPNAVLSSNTPLLVQRALLQASNSGSGSFIYWMQDLISVAQGRKLRRRFGVVGTPPAALLRLLERRLLIRSDGVVAVAPAFSAVLDEYGVSRQRQTVIPNWAPLDEIVPVPRANHWAIAHGAANRIVFLYAGSLGLKHDPLLLVELAAHVPDALIIVVAQGAGADLIAAETSRRGLRNVCVLPSQPYEELSNVLGSADVLVALLDAQGGEYSVPSKVLSYLCAERPILASIPQRNFAAQVLIESGGGVVVEPGAMDDWLSAARQLAADDELRSRLARDGRAYARRMFDIESIADKFEAVISEATARKLA